MAAVRRCNEIKSQRFGRHIPEFEASHSTSQTWLRLFRPPTTPPPYHLGSRLHCQGLYEGAPTFRSDVMTNCEMVKAVTFVENGRSAQPRPKTERATNLLVSALWRQEVVRTCTRIARRFNSLPFTNGSLCTYARYAAIIEGHLPNLQVLLVIVFHL